MAEPAGSLHLPRHQETWPFFLGLTLHGGAGNLRKDARQREYAVRYPEDAARSDTRPAQIQG